MFSGLLGKRGLFGESHVMYFNGNSLYCDDKSSNADAFLPNLPVLVLQSGGCNGEAPRCKSECGLEMASFVWRQHDDDWRPECYEASVRTVSCLFTSRSFPLWATYQMSPLSSFASRGELIIFFCFGRNASSVLNCCYTKYCQFHFLVFVVTPGLHSRRATLTGSKIQHNHFLMHTLVSEVSTVFKICTCTL